MINNHEHPNCILYNNITIVFALNIKYIYTHKTLTLNFVVVLLHMLRQPCLFH
jgi:hypothetical protein